MLRWREDGGFQMFKSLGAAALLTVGLSASAFGAGWSGSYAGLVIGYGVAGAGNGVTSSGAMAGARLGYDQETEELVWGVQGQALFSAILGSNTSTIRGTGTLGAGGIAPPSIISELSEATDWQVDLTGKAGQIAGPALIYFLGGLSAANDRQHAEWRSGTPPTGRGASIGSGTVDMGGSAVHFGIVGGAGAEMNLTSHLAGFVEARYHHYFDASYSFSNGGTGSLPFSSTEVTTGLDWRF
jgi:opacity protein-like surface antigen